MANFNFMHDKRIKFLGSDNAETSRCFTVGAQYRADQTSCGNFITRDNFGDDWHIDRDDDDFEIVG